METQQFITGRIEVDKKQTVWMVGLMVGILLLAGLIVWLIWPAYLIPFVLAYLIGWLNIFAMSIPRVIK